MGVFVKKFVDICFVGGTCGVLVTNAAQLAGWSPPAAAPRPRGSPALLSFWNSGIPEFFFWKSFLFMKCIC
jgi:hypothetical protein